MEYFLISSQEIHEKDDDSKKLYEKFTISTFFWFWTCFKNVENLLNNFVSK